MKKGEPAANRADLTGHVYGDLRVTGPAGTRAYGDGRVTMQLWAAACRHCGAPVTPRLAQHLRKRAGGRYVAACPAGCPGAAGQLPRPANLVGRRFDRLTVRERAPRPPGAAGNNTWWLCDCDCGGTATTTTGRLRRAGPHHCPTCAAARRGPAGPPTEERP